MANRFLDSLCAALENEEPTDDILKDVGQAGSPDLPTQKEANDPDGNPDSPGDNDGNPVGKDDPDRSPEGADLPAEKDANDPSGNPDSPGDENGNPAPASESAIDGAAMELFGKANIERTKDMNVDDVVKKFVEMTKDQNHYDSSPDATNRLKESMNQYNEQYGEKTAMTLRFKTYAGVPCLLSVETSNNNVVDVQFAIPNAHKYRAFSMNAIRKAVGKDIKKNTAANPAPASEMEGFSEDTLTGLKGEVELHKSHNLIETKQAKDAKDPSGNTGDPAANGQRTSTPTGIKDATLDKFVNDSYDKSGNTGDPSSVNGTPVSKSGDSKELGKNSWEKAADDKDGNPDSPGVNGDPAPSFDSFIAACEQLVIGDQLGTVIVPESMSLESYAMELGMGEIASRAMEARLTAAEKNALKDSDFGLPSERKWPLHDESHVRSAIQNFHWCPKEKQRELAKNILKAMRKFGMKDLEVSQGNPFAAYYPEAKIVPRKKPEKKAQ